MAVAEWRPSVGYEIRLQLISKRYQLVSSLMCDWQVRREPGITTAAVDYGHTAKI